MMQERGQIIQRLRSLRRRKGLGSETQEESLTWDRRQGTRSTRWGEAGDQWWAERVVAEGRDFLIRNEVTDSE